jgi:hypothetical protein
MRRPVLVTVAVLGVLVALIGSTGLFAALTDTARTGTNQVDSAGLAASADIRLAPATRVSGFFGAFICGTYSENLASGFFTVTDAVPGYESGPTFFCIKNVGSQNVTLWASADELTDTDTACTGDEALAGDTTCGGDLAGELSAVLSTTYIRWNCDGSTGSGPGVNLRSNGTTPAALPNNLAPAAEACIGVDINYPDIHFAADVQKAQSDRTTWRFKFRADA